MERIAVIGASRGLGAELCKILPKDCEILGVARKQERLLALRSRLGEHFHFLAADLTVDLDAIVDEVLEFGPSKLFYLAAGGPYGEFAEKNFRDHVWAWEVSFLAAMRLVHAAIKQKPPPQIILCGSSVAEASGDRSAASYCSAKHALLGFYQSVKLEKMSDCDIRLFSPGYIDTDLLPKNAEVRYKGVWKPEILARELWDWSCSDDRRGHRIYLPHPS